MADEQEHQWKYEDPEKDDPWRKGLLLSNEIEKFCKVGLLIEDWDHTCLRPASYTLKVGEHYVDSEGKRGRLPNKDDSFVMRPNSIVFVSTDKKLNLPFYIAARFNIRVEWVYRGVLLGTGPQVDPGFKGFLSCPLFNLTDRPIPIRRGEDFATIDFERTTDFCRGKTKDEIKPNIEKGRRLDTVKVDNETFLMFPQEPMQPLQHLKSTVLSSLAELEREVKTWRLIGMGTLVSFIALAISLLMFGVNLYRELSNLTNQVAESKVRIESTTAKIERVERSIDSSGRKQGEKLKGPVQKDR